MFWEKVLQTTKQRGTKCFLIYLHWCLHHKINEKKHQPEGVSDNFKNAYKLNLVGLFLNLVQMNRSRIKFIQFR
jgi:hypothetical protein